MHWDRGSDFGAAVSVHRSLTCIIQQYVLWFQVSVDDPVLVKVLQPTDDLRCVETCSLLIKTRVFFIHIVHMKPVKHGGRMLWYFLKPL